jgi:hypothetical protein
MSLPADKKIRVYAIGDVSGGVNINEPAIAIKENQAQDGLNLIFLQKGCKRWLGCENLTAKDAVNNYFRGMFYSEEIAGTGHLFAMWGGKLYEINTSNGAITEIYNAGGTGEFWGATQWGRFYAANGTSVFKVEGSTAYQVGITPPAAGSAASAAGGSLGDGVYQVYIGYARKVGGLNVLYSQGYSLGSVTLGTGNNTIAITGFLNSADPQVNNKVVWMTNAGGTTFYFYYETDDNATTAFSVASDAAYENAITYNQFALPSGLPPALTGLIIADNRIIGYIGNIVYYSMKSQNGYDIERFPTLNKIEYPFKIIGLFTIGQFLYINTANNGIIIQSLNDLGARFEQYEFKTSFKYMRTVVDWNGGKIGLTARGLQFFDGQKFTQFDYSFNIRPVIQSMFVTADDNFQPVGCIINRENRVEYHLSFRNTVVGSTNSNRTYVLNLSQTYYQDNVNFKTPWEILGRGFNYCADADGQWYFAQSFSNSSTIFYEIVTHTTHKGIYNDAGEYLDLAVDMPILLITKNRYENLFSKISFDKIRFLIMAAFKITTGIIIADKVGLQSIKDVDAPTSAEWDDAEWETGTVWASEIPVLAEAKIKYATRGYLWNLKVEQTSDDISFTISEIQVLGTVETGRGI